MNSTYWQAKLDRNVERDRRNDAALQAAGWTVIRVWEHADPGQAAAGIAATLSGAASVPSLRPFQ
jgi:DNA mismatch endonuclease, patch repair protein